MKNFIKNRVSELNNITWPTRRQATHSMIAVLVIMIIVGFFLSAVDFGLKEIVLKLIGA